MKTFGLMDCWMSELDIYLPVPHSIIAKELSMLES